MKVELTTNESGDWSILEVNGEIVHSGHSVPDHIWLELISEYFKATVIETEISDEEMEKNC